MSLVFVCLLLLVCVAVLLVFGRADVVKTGGGKKRSEYVEKDLVAFPASKFETHVRTIISKLTGKKFPSVYPSWLVFEGRHLELDGYNSELKLAFEAQGPQHTKFIAKLDTRESFEDRLRVDRAKIDLCAKEGIGLIVLDYKVPKHLITAYIKSRIYDIAERWIADGQFDRAAKLGILASKPGDYVEVILEK